MAENLVKIRPTLTDMSVDESTTFPIEQMRSVRALASELGVILERKYKTRTNRADRTIVVTRLA